MEEIGFLGLVERVKKDFPNLKFRKGRKFAFRPPKTIVIETGVENVKKDGKKTDNKEMERCHSLLFLHELGHAVAEHQDYRIDVERVKIEAEAWEKARKLAEKYGVEWDEGFIQGELDSYRDWLHRRSKCPDCGLTRYQTPDRVYHCPRCENLD